MRNANGMEHFWIFTEEVRLKEQGVQHVRSPALVLVAYFTTKVLEVGSFYHWVKTRYLEAKVISPNILV
jgi:hypothetical protein